MGLKHSSIVTFDLAFKGESYPCSFFITDGRLLTVNVTGQRKTAELGSTPPLALAESMAADLLAHQAALKQAALPAQRGGLIETARAWLTKAAHPADVNQDHRPGRFGRPSEPGILNHHTEYGFRADAPTGYRGLMRIPD
jgi:hypothetical protein